MTPTTFPEANTVYGPPSDLEESQCMRIPAFSGTVERGAVEGAPIVVVAWQPTSEDIAAMRLGSPIYISMIGGLAPHFLTTDFHSATHPA
jgi:hypothetical protein